MAKRGRPRYPDILTPREWEVLALLREELSNEAIAQRLDITERTARYHVSEILGKLGVGTRQDAAAWEPEQRPWWMSAAVPLAFVWRKLSFGWLSPAATAGVAVVVVAGVGLLVWGLVRTQEDGAESPPASVQVIPTIDRINLVVVDPPDELVWDGGEVRGLSMITDHISPCGDAATAKAYGVPPVLRLAENRGLGPKEPVLLGLEPEPFEYVPAQVFVSDGYEVSPQGWELSVREFEVSAVGGGVNRLGTNELFLRRLDQPTHLFRYASGFCDQSDGSLLYGGGFWPTRVVELPADIPEIVLHGEEDDASVEATIRRFDQRYGPGVQVVKAELTTSGLWTILLAGDGMGPARPGHVIGFEIHFDEPGYASGASCCFNVLTGQ